MAKIDELAGAVVDLQSTADLVLLKIEELKTAGNLDPQLDAATTAIKDVTTKLNTAIT